MPTVPQIIDMRQERRARTRSRLSLTGLGCAGLVSLVTTTVTVVTAFLYAFLTRALPPPETLAALLQPPDGLLQQPTRLYDRSGQKVILTLENPAAAERDYLPWDSSQSPHLPPELALTHLAIMEPDYWASPGFSLAGIRQGQPTTIAQRLVSDLLLWDEPPSLRRSLRVRLLAAQIIRLYGREKVLEWLLNTIYYGQLAYGVDAGARVYLGKSASELNLAEAALLATVAEAPSLNPIDTPEPALERQRQLLADLLEAGLITSAEFRAATTQELTLQTPSASAPEPMTAFTRLVHSQLVARFGRTRLELGGLRVTTSLDYDLQLQVDCTVRVYLARLSGVQREGTTAEGSPCQAARLLPSLPVADQVQGLDLLASALVLDPVSGQILSLVGDPDQSVDPTNPPGRPPGTLLTPFIHLLAYTRGLSPGSLAWDIPSNLPEPDPEAQPILEPFHGPVRLRTALANDYLTPSLQLLAQLGPTNVWRTAQRLGLTSLEIPGGGQAIRLPYTGGALTLSEVTHAYGVFSNQGVLAGEADLDGENGDLRPVALLRVEDASGRVWLNAASSRTKPVISAQLAYLITHVLSDETARWPNLGHPNPLEIGRPAAAKIGVTLDGRDGWTVGYTPQLLVGVWNGIQSESSQARVPTIATAGLWHAITQYATRDLPPESWPVPAGISTLEVCDPSGMLPTADCPTIVSEVFLYGNEPTQGDTLYRKVQINRETGRLATVFTPPELIEQRVFLSVPPEAEIWAAQAGLPTPPDAYDLIYNPVNLSQEVTLTNPEMFASTRGLVQIRGNAAGEGFDFYRLQFGQGLNPQSWTQIGEDVHQAVRGAILGTWDTRGLEGLYALRLLVVREDQRVDSATIQVTIDNQPPEVQILYPVDGGELANPASGNLTFQLLASDDVALNSVEVYLDGRRVATLTGPPYAVPWRASPGEHELEVQALDLAGNVSQDRVTFSVGN